MKNELDLTDHLILKLLRGNALLTHKQIAEKISLTTSPTFKRIRRLKKLGYILKYTVELDEQKIESHMVVFTMVELVNHSYESFEEFRKHVKAYKVVTNIYHLTGNYDFMLRIKVKDMKEYEEFVRQKLGNTPGLGQVLTLSVLNEENLNLAV